MPPGHASLCLLITLSSLQPSLAAYCRYGNPNASEGKDLPKPWLHSSAGDFSGWSPEDSWEWPDSRGPPTTIRLPDGREFWPSDSRDVVHPREMGFEPVDARWMGKFYKRLFDEYRDYEENNATTGRRMNMLNCHYDLLQNTDLSIAAKADKFAEEAGSLFDAEKRNASGEGIYDKPGDEEKLSNLILKALKVHKKWYGHWYTEQPYKPRGFTTVNLDVNDIYSRYYGGVTGHWSTRANSLEDWKWEEGFFRTMTEYTTFLPMDADWWVKAAEYVSNHPNMSTDRDYLDDAFQAWSKFTHPTTEHVSHRTINLTVLFDRQYTKNDTFDYFSLDQFKPINWTEAPAFQGAQEMNPYELKDVVIARYRNTSTRKIPRANFFYSLYASDYDYNNTYSDLNNLDFGHFQGESSEIESIRETPKTYPPHIPTCDHGFPKDPNYDPDDDVSEYEELLVHRTTGRATTAPITHDIGFRNDMIRTWTTIAVDMDVLLGRNTWPSKRSRSTTMAPRRSRRPGTRTPKVRIKETCHHGLEITNDLHDVKALRNVFERIRHNDTVPSYHTYRKRSTQFKSPKRNVTRTIKTRRPITTAIRHDVNKRDMEGEDDKQLIREKQSVEHLISKRDVGNPKEMFRSKINKRNNIDDKQKAAEIGRPLNHLLQKRSVSEENDGKAVGDGGVCRGDSNNRVLGRLRNFIDVERFRRKRTIVDRKPMDKEDFESHSVGKPLPGELLPVGLRRNRRKRSMDGSAGEYVSRGAKDKAYRSYEDYVKKTKHECQEDRICRLFKEELRRKDSFDGWNPLWQ